MDDELGGRDDRRGGRALFESGELSEWMKAGYCFKAQIAFSLSIRGHLCAFVAHAVAGAPKETEHDQSFLHCLVVKCHFFSKGTLFDKGKFILVLTHFSSNASKRAE